MQVQPINNNYSKNSAYGANFKGKFVMNNALYLHNLTASAEELNVFRNTLKKIGTVNDNVRFSLEVERKWYDTFFNGIQGKNYMWSYKLFKQEGQDEATKEQLGNTIYTDEEAESNIEDNDYSMISPSELLTEISLRLKKFYNHQKIFGLFQDKDTDRDLLAKEISELTVPEAK